MNLPTHCNWWPRPHRLRPSAPVTGRFRFGGSDRILRAAVRPVRSCPRTRFRRDQDHRSLEELEIRFLELATVTPEFPIDCLLDEVPLIGRVDRFGPAIRLFGEDRVAERVEGSHMDIGVPNWSSRRSLMTSVAAFVYVTARISLGSTRSGSSRWVRYLMRRVSAAVFPDPAPAMTRLCLSSRTTALHC